jgi:hypothetical protein
MNSQADAGAEVKQPRHQHRRDLRQERLRQWGACAKQKRRQEGKADAFPALRVSVTSHLEASLPRPLAATTPLASKNEGENFAAAAQFRDVSLVH